MHRRIIDLVLVRESCITGIKLSRSLFSEFVNLLWKPIDGVAYSLKHVLPPLVREMHCEMPMTVIAVYCQIDLVNVILMWAFFCLSQQAILIIYIFIFVFLVVSNFVSDNNVNSDIETEEIPARRKRKLHCRLLKSIVVSMDKNKLKYHDPQSERLL